MRTNRDTSIELIFGSEKGYVNRPKTDNGGPTNMGITQRTLSAWRGYQVTIQQLQALTKPEAWEIYAKNYWMPIRGDELPSGLDYAVMDSCVTSGPSRAAMILQEVLSAAGLKNVDGSPLGIDGSIGANTLAAIKRFPGGVERLIRAYCNARVAWMKTLGGPKGFKSNGRGWTIRVTGIDPKGEWKPVPGVVGNAIRMAAAPAVVEQMVANPNPVDALPVEVIPQSGTKTSEAVVSLPTILAKPEMITGLVTNVVSILAAVGQNTILSYAVAFAIGVGSAIVGYQFVNRIRRENQ